MTPEEFISKWSDETTRAGQLMKYDLVDVISAAVAAEHQRTKEQCAKAIDDLAVKFEKAAVEFNHPRLARSSTVATAYRKGSSTIRDLP